MMERVWNNVAREIAVNSSMRVPAIREWRTRSARTVWREPAELVAPFLSEFRFVSESVGIEAVRGARVAEIGPGDVIPLALLFLGAGARQYVAVDRFLGRIDSPEAMELYSALIDQAPDSIRQGLWRLGMLPLREGWLKRALASRRIVLIREAVESLPQSASIPVDLIFSYNVVEHLSDVESAFKTMARMLQPGGRMIHRVDYAAHGCWSLYDDPLTFLRFSKPLWDLMGSARGYPNRQRHPQIIAALDRAGFRSECLNVTRYPVEAIQKARPKLATDFQELSDDELEVCTAEIVSERENSWNQLEEERVGSQTRGGVLAESLRAALVAMTSSLESLRARRAHSARYR